LVQNTYTNGARELLGICAAAWGQLEPEEQQAWRTYAMTHPIVDRLGASRVLQPSAWFIALNNRLLQCYGDQINLPPIAEHPTPFASVTIEASEGGGTCLLDWPAGSLDAHESAAIWIAVMLPGKSGYYRNRLKMVIVTANGEGTPLDIAGDVAARFGAFVESQIINLEIEKWDKNTGYTSTRITASCVVDA
jgi:hypothetical protein